MEIITVSGVGNLPGHRCDQSGGAPINEFPVACQKPLFRHESQRLTNHEQNIVVAGGAEHRIDHSIEPTGGSNNCWRGAGGLFGEPDPLAGGDGLAGWGFCFIQHLVLQQRPPA